MASIDEKWGKLVAQRGFAQVPNHLLLINLFLDEDHALTPTELLILIQLVGTWWRTNDLPFPSVNTLAIRCGVSGRQIQRSIGRLEKLGFIQRVKRRTRGIVSTNAYDLGPLVNVLTQIAEAFPNPYPRNIDPQIVKRVSEFLPQAKILDRATAMVDETSGMVNDVGTLVKKATDKSTLKRVRPSD